MCQRLLEALPRPPRVQEALRGVSTCTSNPSPLPRVISRTSSRGLLVSEPSYWRSSSRVSSPTDTGAAAAPASCDGGGADMAAAGGETRDRKDERKRATRTVNTAPRKSSVRVAGSVIVVVVLSGLLGIYSRTEADAVRALFMASL